MILLEVETFLVIEPRLQVAGALPPIAYVVGSVGDPFSSLSVLNNSFMGLTPGCHLYYGNVDSHETYEPYEFLEGFENACKSKHPFIVRSYGDAQHMLIVVDRYGRRVRVQPALSRYRVPSGANNTDAVIHWVDPRNRLQQFYSDPVDEGFTIAGFYYFKSRVLVYALSHYAVRFYDLRLHTTKNFVTPYLELLAEADLQLVLPHKLRLYGQGFTSDSDESLSVDVHHADIAPVSLPLKNLIYSSYSGFRAITGKRAKDTHFHFIRSHYIRQAAGNFYLFENHHNHHHYIDHHHHHHHHHHHWSPDMWMLDISNKRWVNPLHAHRRMSYPHAVRRMKHHKFFDHGWARALPIVLANIFLLLFGTVIFLRVVGYYNRENRRRTFGLDSSMSPGTL